LRNDMRIHALLGNLYDRLGRPEDAMKHWRLAAGVVGVLPVLPQNRYLPAADMRGDPTLVDVEQPDAAAAADKLADPPVAASAADYVADDAGATGAAVSRPGATSSKEVELAVSDGSGLDELFDSAPIPGVDVSQTSDGPRRRN